MKCECSIMKPNALRSSVTMKLECLATSLKICPCKRKVWSHDSFSLWNKTSQPTGRPEWQRWPESRTLTFRATQSHGEGAVALIQLSEAGSASVIADHRQLLEDQSLVEERDTCGGVFLTGSADCKCSGWHFMKFEKNIRYQISNR